MIKIVKADKEARESVLREMRARAAGVNREITDTAEKIMEDIGERGYTAVEEYSIKFDGSAPYELTHEDLENAAGKCDPELYKAMERAAEEIRDYQSRLVPKSMEWGVNQSSCLGQIVRGLDRVGLYVPGGKAAYPSTVLMTAIPARVAGTRELVMLTPPTENLNVAVMAAAKIAGVDRVIAVGGVQAVAAVTYGAGFIPKVDKLVGPGNAYVTAGKRFAYGRIDIDMTAGPSEVLIIADDTAKAEFVAADMLSQAEHDPLASSILVTTSQALADRVRDEIERLMEEASRREIIKASIQDYGAILMCETLTEAAEIANEIAPEHLEIMTENPRALLGCVRNAGAVFLGEYSPEPLGDYMAGPSHVLPTSGTARFFSPLSVDSFLKKTSLIEYSKEDLQAVHRDIEIIAESEKLTAHARSIKVRF